jgi:hypothetical protein
VVEVVAMVVAAVVEVVAMVVAAVVEVVAMVAMVLAVFGETRAGRVSS